MHGQAAGWLDWLVAGYWEKHGSSKKINQKRKPPTSLGSGLTSRESNFLKF